jgi:hypothetical protein
MKLRRLSKSFSTVCAKLRKQMKNRDGVCSSLWSVCEVSSRGYNSPFHTDGCAAGELSR